MMKNLNWNMLHFNQCPNCRGDLLPVDADMTKFICSNSIEKGKKRCTFSIYPSSISRITNSLKVRVFHR